MFRVYQRVYVSRARDTPLKRGNNAIRTFSVLHQLQSYEDTIPNLKIGSHTRVIFQGFTGKQGTANAQESLAWGTKIVGGVKPNSEGEHLGLPVLQTVQKAVEVLKPDATGIYVAASQAPAAIEEAIEAEIPLIVAVAEHIPLHSILRVSQFIRFSFCVGIEDTLRFTLSWQLSQSRDY
jgi:succinyl-CoA synthetase alpha subunit